MSYHTSEWLLNGILETYTPEEMVVGFETIIASKINRGSTLLGNIYVDPIVTPLFNKVKGAMSNN